MKISVCSLILLICLLLQSTHSLAQTFTVNAPPNQFVQTFDEAPSPDLNGAYRRAVFYISPHEMAPYSGLSITSMSIPIAVNTNTQAASGSFSLYMQNDIGNQLSAWFNYSSNLPGMTSVFAGSLTIPAAGGSFMSVSFQTPFTYTGGGIKMVYDWQYQGPYQGQVYAYGNSVFTSAVANATQYWTLRGSSSAAPVASVTGFSTTRPSFIFGVQNTMSNDLKLLDVTADGNIISSGGNIPVQAYVCNSGTNAAQNVTVSLFASGANNFTTNVVIPSMPPGTTQTVNFTPPSGLLSGLTSQTVQIRNSDQVSSNNSLSFSQSVTCNEFAPSVPHVLYPWYWYSFAGDAMMAPLRSTVSRTMTAVRVKCSSAVFQPGDGMYPLLCDAQGVIIATGPTVQPVGGQIFTLTLQAPTLLNPNQQYYFGVGQDYAGDSPVGLDFSNGVTPVPCFYRFGNGGAPFELEGMIGSSQGMFAQFTYSAPAISASSNTYICAGTTITLQASSAQTFSWSTGATTPTIAVSPSTTAVYKAVAYNANCNAVKTISVNVSPQPSLNIIIPPLCKDATATFTASGAWSYTWSNSYYNNIAPYSFSSAGLQTISVTGQNVPCPPVTAVKQVTVRALPNVSFTSSQQTYCNLSVGGTTIQFTGQPAGGQYSGSLSSAGVFTPAANGTYTAVYSYTSPTSQCSNQVNLAISVSDCTGMTAPSLVALRVFPNPSADGQFTVEGLSDEILVLNSAGQAVTFNRTGNVVDLGSLPEGIYLLLNGTGEPGIRLVKSR